MESQRLDVGQKCMYNSKINQQTQETVAIYSLEIIQLSLHVIDRLKDNKYCHPVKA